MNFIFCLLVERVVNSELVLGYYNEFCVGKMKVFLLGINGRGMSLFSFLKNFNNYGIMLVG